MTNQIYYTDVPNPPSNPSTDVPSMKSNTNALPPLLEIDHFGFADNDGGRHKRVQMVAHALLGGRRTGEGTIYTQSTIVSNPVTSESELYFVPDNTSDEYQLTRTITANYASFGNYTAVGTVTTNYGMLAGWTFLPGGILLQYGNVISTLGTPQISPSSIVVTFPVVYSTSNIVVTITPISKAAGTNEVHVPSLRNTTTSTAGFTVNYDSSTTSYVGFSWTAIGK